ncbi:MAG: MBL fold metallo-hydrolase, partial [Pseudonocardia sp.]
SEVHGVVLSHGHADHTGGLAGLAVGLGRRAMPMVLHPRAWARRRLVPPGGEAVELPTLSKRALAGEGFEVVERREPSLLVDGSVLVTGEVDRTTEFEHGMPPPHQAWTGTGWEHDPLVRDDQALVVHVRDRGLVVLTGCGHAGAINIVRHAQRLTGVGRLHALIGGLHLSGPAFEPVIPPTLAALARTGYPDVEVCTGDGALGGEQVHTVGHTDGKPIALICDDDQSVDPDALLGVLDRPAEAAWSGVTVAEADPLHGLRLRLLPKGAIIDKHHTRLVITYP